MRRTQRLDLAIASASSRRSSRAATFCIPTVVLIASVVGEGRAAAQDRGYAQNRLDPAEVGSDWFTTESLDLRGSLRPFAGVLGDWSYAPLVRDGTKIIEDSVTTHVRGAVNLADRVRVALSLPIALYQHGDDWSHGTERVYAPETTAVSDVHLSSDVRVFGAFGDVVRGAAGVAVSLPTGSREAYTSDGTFRFAPRVLLAGDVRSFTWAGKLGFAFRPRDDVFAGRTLGSDLTFAVSAGIRVNDRVVFGPELHGGVTATGASSFTERGTAIEILLGGRVRLGNHFQAGSSIGSHVTAGDGGATLRVLGVFEYAPDVCVDKDGDGICAYEDACPEVDGVRSIDPKTNGCPIDSDGDHIPDRADKCPDLEGERTIDPLTIGCPDRDHDGVADPRDACPDVPGLTNVEPSKNGCPKPSEEEPPNESPPVVEEPPPKP